MRLSIEKLIYGGDGLARTPAAADGRSLAVFVPFVLPGEKIDAGIHPQKSGFARASSTQLVEVSPDRVQPHCLYFQQCGGCHYQHIRYPDQLQFKAAILRETLQRIAKIDLPSEIQLHPSPPWNYRNRTRLQIQLQSSSQSSSESSPEFIPEFAIGYFRFRSHDLLSVLECPISSPLLNRVITRLLDQRGFNCPSAVQEVELFADAADQRLLAWAFCGREADRAGLLRWAEALRHELPEITGVTFFSSRRRTATPRMQALEEFEEEDAPLNQQMLAQSGAPALLYRTQNHDYQVGAGAFFQVNRFLIDELVSVVTGNATGNLALDLYAGVGLFSAALAQNFHHIFGVEASQTSYGDFTHNVPANVKAVGARTEDYLSGDYLRNRRGQARPDLVVLDPPRSGAGKSVMRSLVELGALRIRYVSCDPATLARDIAPLLVAGYRIEEAHLFDLFPETYHIESVMLLAR